MNNSNPKKPLIAVLTSSYPRFPGDSSSVFLQYLYRNIRLREFEVHVIAPDDRSLISDIEDDIIVHRFQYFPKSWQRLAYDSGIVPNLRRHPAYWIQVPFFLISMTWSLLRFIHKNKPDIIHAHWLIPQGLIAFLTKPFHNGRIVVTSHGTDTFVFRNRFFRFINRAIIKGADAWTANTKATANAIPSERSLPAPHIIPMGIDIERFRSGIRTRFRGELDENEMVILFVGRLVSQKGIQDLILAFSRLPPDVFSRTYLWIVGNGNKRSELEKQANYLCLQKKVVFWGKRSQVDLPDFYSAADLFVGPSLIDSSGASEGQGVVFLEAFASGTPVIATNVGGIPNIIDDGSTGVLVSPHSPEELSQAISDLLNNEERRQYLIRNAQQLVQDNYDWEIISDRFIRLYYNILGRNC